MITLPWILFIGLGLIVAGRTAPREDASNRFFAATNLPHFHIEMGELEVARLEVAPRHYVRATVKLGAQKFTNVGIRLKGFGTYQSLSRKPSLALKFNKFIPGQELQGLTKILLNNSGHDPTYFCELLASGLFQDAGVPTPRITHARVDLNGRDLGYYVLAEAVNERFLSRYFSNTKGNLYEGSIGDIRSRLERDGGNDPASEDLSRLAAAANLADPNQRQTALREVLDVDRFLKFIAIEMMASSWDGYALHWNNYRVYHDPTTDRMAFIPHGLDNTMRETHLSLMPPRKSILVRALLHEPEGREQYWRLCGDLYTNVFRLEVLTNRLNAALQRLVAAARTSDEASYFAAKSAAVQERLRQRAKNLSDQLAGIKPPTPVFDSRGVASLKVWHKDSDWVSSTLEQRLEGNKTSFYIKADKGSCTASWRAHLFLPPGRYRFEGVARTTGVRARGSHTGMGAGLRLLGNQREQGLQENTDWSPLAHEFKVQEGCEDVELLCELRALQGEAWFDAASLRLLRLN